SIGSAAFFSENNVGALTDLSGLSHVKKIDVNAFNGQTKLTKIDLPNATSVGYRAFAYVPAMEVNLPNVTSVGDEAFYQATNITKVNLGITDTTQLATMFKDSADKITSFTLNNVTETPDIGDKEEAATKKFPTIYSAEYSHDGKSQICGSNYFLQYERTNTSQYASSRNNY
nr:leucine-rich repeat protein [Leuconostoc sp.]